MRRRTGQSRRPRGFDTRRGQWPMRWKRRAWWLVPALLGLAVLCGWLGRRYQRWAGFEHSQDAVILAAARRYGVDPALVKAVVWRESRFNPSARGRAGEIGLMQLTDAAAQEWAEAEGVYPLPETHLFDPRTNTLAGTWYLRRLLQRYADTDDPLPYALADYNAGRRNVLRWMQGPARTRSEAFRAAIGFESTRAYVEAVMDRRPRYRRDF